MDSPGCGTKGTIVCVDMGERQTPDLYAYPWSWLIYKPKPRAMKESFLSFRSELRHHHHWGASRTLPRF